MRAQVTLETITEAMENDEFVFYYQPQVSFVTGEVSGAEALIRWQKDDGSIIEPPDFVPLAEESGLISDITLHMFPKLLTDLRLIGDVDKNLSVAFNVSSKDFETSLLKDAIFRALQLEQDNIKSLELEITEASLLSEDNDVSRNLCALPKAGVRIVMDDFGAGFSTIDMLGRCPFGAIKLEKKIVQRMSASDKDIAIIQSSIRLAHKLNVDVIAEGIEDWKTYQFLLNAGCTHAQGHWISGALPLLELLDLLRRRPRWPGLPIGLLHMTELDHIEWRKTLMDAVYALKNSPEEEGKTASLHRFPELDYTACSLGRWYYGAGQRFSGRRYFDEMEEPHRRLHEIGKQLLDAVRTRSSSDKIVKHMRAISDESAIIIGLLQKLQNDALADLDGTEAEWLSSAFDHVDKKIAPKTII